MTAQVADQLRVGDETLWLAEADGTGLFDPTGHGLVPAMASTACWRGYQCVYAVAGGRLVLAALHLGPGTTLHGRPVTGREPLLGGTVAPIPARESWFGLRFRVRDIAEPVPFTGTLLGGRGVVEPGPGAAWRYERVLEVGVVDGEVAEVRDRWAEMAELRRARAVP